MEDYGNMEKVGDLGQQLERNDKHITTQPGDVIDLDATELRTALGQGDMTVTLTLAE